jgi:hypothetical protein
MLIDIFYQLTEIFDLLQHDTVRTLPSLEKILEKQGSGQWLKWAMTKVVCALYDDPVTGYSLLGNLKQR